MATHALRCLVPLEVRLGHDSRVHGVSYYLHAFIVHDCPLQVLLTVCFEPCQRRLKAH